MQRVGTIPPGLVEVHAATAHVALTLMGIKPEWCQWKVGMGRKPCNGA